MDSEIHLADLSSEQFISSENAPKKLFWTFVIFVFLVLACYGLSFLLGGDTAAPVLMALILGCFVFLCARSVMIILQIHFSNRGMCSAVEQRGNTLTVMSLKSDFEPVADTFVGLMGLTYSNGFNTEDLLGYQILRNGANASGSGQNARVRLMQDESFVRKCFEQRVDGIRYKEYRGCTLEKETDKALIFSAVKGRLNTAVTLKLPKTYKDLDRLRQTPAGDTQSPVIRYPQNEP